MTDRNAKPFTLFIFCLIFALVVLSQVFIKAKYEALLQDELDDFTDLYTDYTEMLDEKICLNLNAYSAFKSAPDSVYQKMLDASCDGLEGVDAAYIVFNNGRTLWSSSSNSNLDINDINIEEIVLDTDETVGIYRYYTENYVYYAKKLYYKQEQKGIICLQVSYDKLLNSINGICNRLSWLNIIVKNKNSDVIYLSSNRIERNPEDEVSMLFENSDDAVNEGNKSIIYETKTIKNTSNKDLIGNYDGNASLGEVEREVIRRSKFISSTSLGNNLQISVSAFSSLKDIDSSYYSRFIIMLFFLVIILIAHLIAGFYISDKNMPQEFLICLFLYIVIFLTHYILELGFLSNIYENELDYYGKVISEMSDVEYNWTIQFVETTSEMVSLQDEMVGGEGYDPQIVNSIIKQIVSESDNVTCVGIRNNGQNVYSYPHEYDMSEYNSYFKEAGDVKSQKVFFNKARNSLIVLMKIRSNYNPNAILFAEMKINDGSALIKDEKFEVFGFRDAYGDTKLLNISNDEAIESFVEKISFDEKNQCQTGIKRIDGTLYGYVMMPNQIGNINVYRYELESLYTSLVYLFIVVMMLLTLIVYFANKVYNGYKDRRETQNVDTVYDKLIEKIDQDIGDYGDDMLE